MRGRWVIQVFELFVLTLVGSTGHEHIAGKVHAVKAPDN